MQSSNDWITTYICGALTSALLQRVRVESLLIGATVDRLAAEANVSKEILRPILQYLALASSVIEAQPSGIYRLVQRYRQDQVACFRLLKFVGAYGPNLSNVWSSLSSPSKSAALSTNDKLLAEAYRQLASKPLYWVGDLLDDIPFTSMIEVGCGSAPVLRILASRRPSLRGWAIDCSPHMIELAEELIERAGLGSRVHVVQSDLADVAAGRFIVDQPTVEAICLRNVLNSMFRSGASAVVECLKGMKSVYPRAYVIVVDYYGRLNTEQPKEEDVATLSQDIVQLLSGQGIPPAHPEDWDSIYDAAGLKCVDRHISNSVKGVCQFADILVARQL